MPGTGPERGLRRVQAGPSETVGRRSHDFTVCARLEGVAGCGGGRYRGGDARVVCGVGADAVQFAVRRARLQRQQPGSAVGQAVDVLHGHQGDRRRRQRQYVGRPVLRQRRLYRPRRARHDLPFLAGRLGQRCEVDRDAAPGSRRRAHRQRAGVRHLALVRAVSPAPWFSMAQCDPNSYPQTPCTPESDANAPACINSPSCSPTAFPGGGSAFMEMQFYPPGVRAPVGGCQL